MNSGQMVDHIAKKTKLSKGLVRAALKEFYSTVQSEVKSGKKVSIAGFGVFESLVRKSRVARNPLTGESVKVPTKKVPKFRAGKSFRDVFVKKQKKKTAKKSS